MGRSIGFGIALVLLGTWNQTAIGHEWSDSTGNYKVAGTLIAMDAMEIVIKLDKGTKGHELLAIPIENLSESDRKYVESIEAANKIKVEGDKQTWTFKNGLTVLGKIVDFAQRDVTIQRRRGKVYVNDHQFENLPEVYRRLVPKIVEHFEQKSFKDEREFMAWVTQLRAEPRTYKCEGVMLELASGDEYAIPFFVFSDKDAKLLKPAWDKWIAARDDERSQVESQRQHALYLQSQAAAYQQQQSEMMQIARLQLQLTAVAAGVVDVWEVYLYPPPDSYAYPMSVVVYANNSLAASDIAMQNNPGYTVGPIRKIAGR